MSILSNALSGAAAAQAGLNTVGHNLSNMSTRGFSRQGVLLNAIGPASGVRSAGNGVAVTGLLRINDSYKSQQMWRANSSLGQYPEPQRYLSQLEKVMSGSKSSISYGIDQFFSALNAAAADPTSTPYRQQVITAADSMAQYFNQIYSVTVTQQTSIKQQRDAMLPQINTTLQSIATLNKQIAEAKALGTNDSALLDARDTAIDDLSGMVAIEVQEQADGSRSISLKSGQPLVISNVASSFTTSTTAGVETLQLDLNGSIYVVDGTNVGGQLGGLTKFEKNTLAPLQQSITDLAWQLQDKINSQLALGRDSAGNGPGAPLLTFTAGGSGGLLKLAPNVTAAGLAFAGPPPNNLPGNSANLLELVKIIGAPIPLTSIGTVILRDADTQLLGKLAIESKQNQALMETANTIREQSVDDWAATSAVNKDEEAVNLSNFEAMYNANLKVIAVANTLFDSLLATIN